MQYAQLVDTSDVPPHVMSHPSMMTSEEKALLFHLARDYYSGKGVIVDAGLFLGASTVAFGAGITASGNAKPRCIHAYDIAKWNRAGFDKYLEDPAVAAKVGALRLAEGEDYTPLLAKLIGDYLPLVELRIGDVVKEVRGDEPVEIAFFDLLKNHERDWAVFKALGPCYIPGRTIIIQQDYFFEDAIESKIRQEFLAPHFEFIGGFGTSGVFRLASPIPGEYFENDPVKDLDAGSAIALLRQAASRIRPSKFQLYALLAVVRFMMFHKLHELARQELTALESTLDAIFTPRARAIVKKIREDLR